MRNLMVSLAAGGGAAALVTLAAVQYYPVQRGAPNGNGNGYSNNYEQVRSPQVRIDAIRRQINQLDRSDRIRNGTADRLRSDANSLERGLQDAARDGMSFREANDIQIQLARLEQQVRYPVANGYGRNGYNRYNNGYGNYDRDDDGRDDRYEDDQGRDHDDRYQDDQGRDHDDD